MQVVAIFGGMSSQKQVRLLKSKPEVIVATPGRLWDIMNNEVSLCVALPYTVICMNDEYNENVLSCMFFEMC